MGTWEFVYSRERRETCGPDARCSRRILVAADSRELTIDENSLMTSNGIDSDRSSDETRE